MSEQTIIERILSDAETEAREIIANAEKKAAERIAEASRRAQRDKIGVEAEVKERVKGIFDGKAATARLDGAKILLDEKRGVIDKIYSNALEKLAVLNKADSVFLANRLLTEYAEDGDEIVFAENYRYKDDVLKLEVVKEKNLKLSSKSAKTEGGFILCGKNSDKNISYAALIEDDRQNHEAEIAAEIFVTG